MRSEAMEEFASIADGKVVKVVLRGVNVGCLQSAQAGEVDLAIFFVSCDVAKFGN